VTGGRSGPPAPEEWERRPKGRGAAKGKRGPASSWDRNGEGEGEPGGGLAEGGQDPHVLRGELVVAEVEGEAPQRGAAALQPGKGTGRTRRDEVVLL